MTINVPPQLSQYLREHDALGRSTIADLLDEKDRKAYPASLIKNIFAASRREKSSGVAGAVSKFLETLNPSMRDFDFGILAPLDMLCRNLAASTGSTGGYLIGVDVLPLQILLRPISLLQKLGAMLITGLKSNQVIPRQITESSPYTWLAEGDTLNLQDESFGQVALSPHRLGGGCVLTRQLEFQTIPNMSDHVIDSLAPGIFAEFDRVGFNGKGVLGEPGPGIFQAPNLPNQVTFGATAALAAVASFETKLAQSNVTNPICFVADPLTRAKWRGIARTSNSSKTLWDDDRGVENVIGHDAYVTTNVPASSVVALDATKIIFATFGEGSPLSIITDPYSQKRSEKIEISCYLHGDVAIANNNAVCINTDSTTQ